ncbi:MAG: nucleoside hydrolase [Streptosporangiaceae bacterium]
MAAPAVVLDCDPGNDDFLAIVLAQRFADLRGITTVAGNTSLANTTRNACIAADICGFRGPVVAGASGPLLGEPQFAEHVHGASGLDGPDLPVVIRSATDGEASSFLIDTCGPDTWLIATGPLTNVALAIRRDPGFSSRLAGISLMGGSTSYGNVTSAAEFNIWADPEAASVVFNSGARLRMVGLNVTHTVLVDSPFVQRIRQLATPPARFVGDLLEAFVIAYGKMSRQPGFAPIHDPCALLWVTHPDLFGSVPARVDIELAGAFARGMTVVDLRELSGITAGNADVAMSADSARVLDLLYETVSAL